VSTAPRRRTGAQILVDQLKIHGADTVFAVPGESYLAVLDALYDANSIRLVTCRQEGGAAMMADAYGKLTGRPGLCMVTRGPGATNASAGLHVKVWAVTSRNGTSVLLINKGPRSASVSLCCGAARQHAQIERLSAPSITSRSGVTLAGRFIGRDGRWHGRELMTAIRPSGRRYHMLLPGYSAAVVRAAKL